MDPNHFDPNDFDAFLEDPQSMTNASQYFSEAMGVDDSVFNDPAINPPFFFNQPASERESDRFAPPQHQRAPNFPTEPQDSWTTKDSSLAGKPTDATNTNPEHHYRIPESGALAPGNSPGPRPFHHPPAAQHYRSRYGGQDPPGYIANTSGSAHQTHGRLQDPLSRFVTHPNLAPNSTATSNTPGFPYYAQPHMGYQFQHHQEQGYTTESPLTGHSAPQPPMSNPWTQPNLGGGMSQPGRILRPQGGQVGSTAITDHAGSAPHGPQSITPPKPVFAPSMTSFEEARSHLSARGPNYLSLEVENDDHREVESHKVGYATRIFDALLQQPANCPEKLIGMEADFRTSQNTAFKQCKSGLSTPKQILDASAHCMLLVEAIVNLHKEGVPLAELNMENQQPRGDRKKRAKRGDPKKVAPMSTKSKYVVDLHTKCSDQSNNATAVVGQNKLVALDIINGRALPGLAFSPDGFLYRKQNNFKSNNTKTKLVREGLKATGGKQGDDQKARADSQGVVEDGAEDGPAKEGRVKERDAEQGGPEDDAAEEGIKSSNIAVAIPATKKRKAPKSQSVGNDEAPARRKSTRLAHRAAEKEA